MGSFTSAAHGNVLHVFSGVTLIALLPRAQAAFRI